MKMNRLNNRRPIVRCATVLVIVAVMVWPFPLGAAIPAEVTIDQRLGNFVPLDTHFRDDNGVLVTLQSIIRDRPVILQFVYHDCPMLCNMSLDGLVRTLRILPFAIGDAFEVVTVSINPRETVRRAAEVKREIVRRYGQSAAEEHWHFLTGDSTNIDRLAASAGFRYRYERDTGQFAHAAGIVLLTPHGQISRYFLGIDYPARDLRWSLVEASGDKIGSLADQVMLLCFQYDPSAGRYTLAIFNGLRVMGIATVGLLVSGIARMLWREWRGTGAKLSAETSIH